MKSIEFGWLIEFNPHITGKISYYGKVIEGLGQTEDSLDAIRFSRKQDAELIIEDYGWTGAKAVEHSWG